MDGYDAASSRGELVVEVAGDGVPLRVRLSPAVMDLPAEELASCGCIRWRICAFSWLSTRGCEAMAGTSAPFGQQRKSRHMRGPSISEGHKPMDDEARTLAASVAARIGCIQAAVD